ncbi:MAG: serine/threonine-protein kinase [Planctomycetota bacterium]|jgi:tetratricopeptide (TPR) repeat protein/predicted Ser/Thr protein kinase
MPSPDPPAPSDETRFNPLPSEGVGDTIGRYRLVSELGAGGFGVVYLAEQTEPVQREVALKVIKLGMDTRQVIARFEAERQALALMDHPNIAGVLDAGSTASGRPFFVMELVRGDPITEFCDRRRVGMTERLDLFMAVCDAVQHAHQKGIIHRDLKPSNVLVTEREGAAVAKVIDFGIAKATDQRLTERTVFTEQGVFIGTPAYMSPEQAAGAGLDVDTRSDVYSLGVLLYELLTGATPFDAERLRSAGYAELCRIIREEEPHRPSTRTTVRTLRGDIDWIVMKALEKDRRRRYASPSELAADVRRHLDHEPVVAGPPSRAYRVAKFARRHRVGVSFAAVVGLLLVTLAATMTVQAGRIARERDRAETEARTAREVTDFVVGLFDAADPSETRGEDVTARELVDRGARRVADLADEPLVQAEVMQSIGYVYLVMGIFDESAALLEEAVRIRETRADEDPRALASSLHVLSLLYDVRGDAERAEPLARRAVAIRETLDDRVDLAQSLNALGNSVWHQDRMDEAEAIFRRSLAIREAELGPDHEDLAQSLHNLGAMMYFADDPAEAERLWRRAIEIARAARGDDDWGLATTMHTLAIVLSDTERYDEALDLELEALAIRRKVLGPEHPYVALSLCTLGNIQRGMGDAAAAEPNHRRAVEIAEAAWGETHGEVWWMMRSHGRTLIALDRWDEAEAGLARLLALLEAPGAGGDAGDRGLARAALAEVRAGRGRVDEAVAEYGAALDLMEEAWGRDDPDHAETLGRLVDLLRAHGRDAEADAVAADRGGAPG